MNSKQQTWTVLAFLVCTLLAATLGRELGTLAALLLSGALALIGAFTVSWVAGTGRPSPERDKARP